MFILDLKKQFEKEAILIKFVLAEYRGLILEVYKADNWYSVPSKDKMGKDKIRWAFNGSLAEDSVRSTYLNKSILKKRGTANPIRYKI